MNRRDFIALCGSATLLKELKGQNCNIANYPPTFIGPRVASTRAVDGFANPYGFAKPTWGYGYKELAVKNDGTNAYVTTDSNGKQKGCTDGIIHHPGTDINYGSGWDDFGLPVYACADGVATYVRPTQEHINTATKKNYTVGEWMVSVYGSTVVPTVAQQNADPFVEFTGANGWVGVVLQHFYMGKIYHSLYGHVMQIDRTIVQKGQSVCKGTQIAQIAGLPSYSPHLHFEIRNSYFDTNEKRGYRPYNEKGFCNATSNDYVDKRTFDPLQFVQQHPSYDRLIANEIATVNDTKQNPKPDTRFIAPSGSLVLQSNLPIDYKGLEVRMIPYTFVGNRQVSIYHFLDPANEQNRFASFWDPDKNSFQNLSLVKLD